MKTLEKCLDYRGQSDSSAQKHRSLPFLALGGKLVRGCNAYTVSPIQLSELQ